MVQIFFFPFLDQSRDRNRIVSCYPQPSKSRVLSPPNSAVPQSRCGAAVRALGGRALLRRGAASTRGSNHGLRPLAARGAWSSESSDSGTSRLLTKGKELVGRSGWFVVFPEVVKGRICTGNVSEASVPQPGKSRACRLLGRKGTVLIKRHSFLKRADGVKPNQTQNQLSPVFDRKQTKLNLGIKWIRHIYFMQREMNALSIYCFSGLLQQYWHTGYATLKETGEKKRREQTNWRSFLVSCMALPCTLIPFFKNQRALTHSADVNLHEF